MKALIFLLVFFSATLANEVDNSIDLKSITLCATLNNVYRTFANIWEVYNEFKTTGQLWVPVATSACPVTPVDCTVLSPVCAVTRNNFFKTFPNQCVLEAEQKATGTAWNIVFNGICTTNPADGFVDSNSIVTAQQPLSTAQNNDFRGNSVQDSAQANSEQAPMPTPSLSVENQSEQTPLRPYVLTPGYSKVAQEPQPPPIYSPPPYNQKPPNSRPQQAPLPSYSAPSQLPRYYLELQQSQTAKTYPASSSVPANYDQVSSQVQSEQGPLQTNTPGQYPAQEIQPSPTYPSPSPGQDNYHQEPSQSQPKQGSLRLYASHSQVPGYLLELQQSQTLKPYPSPSSVNANNGQVSLEAHSVQAPLRAYAPVPEQYMPAQEGQSLPTCFATSADQASYDQGPLHSQQDQTSLLSYATPSQAPEYQNSPEHPKTSPTSSGSSPVPAKYDLVSSEAQSVPPPSRPYAPASGQYNPTRETYSAPSPGPDNYDQGPSQSQHEQAPLPSYVTPSKVREYQNSPQKPQNSQTYEASSPVPAKYVQAYSQGQSIQAPLRPYTPVPEQYNSANEAQSSQIFPRLDNYDQGPSQSQQEQSRLPLYGTPSQVPEYQNSPQKLQTLPTSSASLPVPDKYGLVSLEAQSVQAPIRPYDPAPEQYIPSQEEQFIPTCSAPSPGQANYDQGPSQSQHEQSLLQLYASPSKISEYQNSPQTPQSSPTYAVTSPVPAKYGQAYSQAQSIQAPLRPYAPGIEKYNPAQEAQSLEKYSALSPIPANYDQGPSQPQNQQASLPLYATPSKIREYQNSTQTLPNSPTYVAPSPASDKYGLATGQYNPAEAPQPSQAYSAPCPDPAKCDQVQSQSQPQQTSLPSYAPPSYATKSLITPALYNSVQQQQSLLTYSTLSPYPANYDQGSSQSQDKQAKSPSAELSPTSNLVREPPSLPVNSGHPMPSNYASAPSQSQYEGARPPVSASLLYGTEWSSASRNFNPAAYYQQASEQHQPEQNPPPSHVSPLQYDAASTSTGQYGSVKEAESLPKYSVPTNYDKDYLHVQPKQPSPSRDAPPLSFTEDYNSYRKSQPSPSYPSPTPIQAVPASCPSFSPLSSSATNSLEEPLPSPVYPALSSDPANYDKGSPHPQPQQASLVSYDIPSQVTGNHISTQESQSLAQDSQPVPIYDQGPLKYKSHQASSSSYEVPGSDNSNQGPSKSQPQQVSSTLYVSPSQVPVYHNSHQEPQPSANYGQGPQLPKPQQAPLPSYDPSSYVLGQYSTNHEPQHLPTYPASLPAPSKIDQGPLPQQAPLPLYHSASVSPGHYNSVYGEQILSTYSVPSSDPTNYDQHPPQYQPQQASLPSHASLSNAPRDYSLVQVPQPSPTYSASSATSTDSDKLPAQAQLNQPAVKPYASSSCNGSTSAASEYYNSAQELQPSPNYPTPSPISQDQPIEVPLPSSHLAYVVESPTFANGNRAGDTQSSEGYLLPKDYYNNDEQSAPDSAPCHNGKAYTLQENENLHSEPQVANDITLTSDESNNLLNQYKSHTDKSSTYNDVVSSNQNNQDEAPTIYNGVVYQGTYHYQPKYKHINFGNFNFLPAPVPSADPIPESQYHGYSTNPFEQLLQQLQYIASKNYKSSY